jgi:thiol-disulfide isomerase/thioredoxin
MIRRFLAVAIVAMVLTAPVMAGAAANPEAAAKPGPATRPDLKITTLDGKPFDLAAQRGKWVVVNYWATWCVPCIKEMPDISAFVKKNGNVTAIGLAFEDTDAKEIKAFVEKHPVAYPIAQVDVSNPPKAFDEPKGLPTTYLIAPDGTLAKRFIGPVTEESLGKAIGEAGKATAKGK